MVRIAATRPYLDRFTHPSAAPNPPWSTNRWREVSVALAVGGIEVAAKFPHYYIHERIWTHVSFGIR
ncbi:MAG: hypothetical protein COV99_00630 [Bacteroidetes bacterium CG12_big_fil_rev_8_21_14_0_65_60_17]|nr:MAG: hypothetical protein COV99_00630 [Bacteroidetes bacterium CG12_big_fil_rev_8_21_14_0_65_60_17]